MGVMGSHTLPRAMQEPRGSESTTLEIVLQRGEVAEYTWNHVYSGYKYVVDFQPVKCIAISSTVVRMYPHETL